MDVMSSFIRLFPRFVRNTSASIINHENFNLLDQVSLSSTILLFSPVFGGSVIVRSFRGVVLASIPLHAI